MKVEIIAPAEFQGNVIGGINQRMGSIVDTEVRDEEFTVICEVPLNVRHFHAFRCRSVS